MTPRRAGQTARVTFKRVVGALDGSLESIEAAYQGCRIAPDAPATLVFVLDPGGAPNRAADYPAWVHASRDAASAMLSEASGRLADLGVTADVHPTVEEGDVLDGLIYVTSSTSPPVLLTVGSGEEKESVGTTPPVPPGVGVTSRVVEEAGCSVLVARCATDPGRFPAGVTVGVDGSAPSLYAYRVAAAIAEHSGCELTVVTALGGKGPDLRALREAPSRVPVDKIDPDHPVSALVQTAVEDGLIVVGNRGRHGLRALGSVSAAVAARSPTSVLVAREP